jgi:hypothetical protein
VLKHTVSPVERWLTRIGAFIAAVLTAAGGFWATWQQAAPMAYLHSFKAFDSTWLWFLRFVCSPFLSAGFELGLESPIEFVVELILDLAFWFVLFGLFLRWLLRRMRSMRPSVARG